MTPPPPAPRAAASGGSPGMTAVEMIVVVAILGILAVPLATFLSSSLRDTTRATLQLDSQDSLRGAFDKLERDFLQMNEVTVSSSTLIEFRLDRYRLPGYSDSADDDGDGITNLMDPDDDDDATVIYAASASWQGGYDHKDDDDDGDGEIDVQCRYYLSGTDLLRDFNYNEAGWGQNVDVVAANVSSFTLTYYGSKQEDLGRFIDLGNDGTSSTGDSGENDGIITAREIDWVQAATGHGNRSGLIDTANERRYIIAIDVYVAHDKNRDGTDDFKLQTILAPPLLPVKRSF